MVPAAFPFHVLGCSRLCASTSLLIIPLLSSLHLPNKNKNKNKTKKKTNRKPNLVLHFLLIISRISTPASSVMPQTPASLFLTHLHHLVYYGFTMIDMIHNCFLVSRLFALTDNVSIFIYWVRYSALYVASLVYFPKQSFKISSLEVSFSLLDRFENWSSKRHAQGHIAPKWGN